MSDEIFSDDDIRLWVEHLKDKFIGWRIPPVELPPDSIIAKVCLDIARDGYFRSLMDSQLKLPEKF